MNKTKLITGIVLFAMTLVITVSSCFYGNEINNDVKLTEDKVKALQSVNADIITKSVNQVSYSRLSYTCCTNKCYLLS